MKLTRIALAASLIMPAAMSAHAGVTLSPLLLGYHYMGEAHKEQRAAVNASTPGVSVTQESGLYTGAGIGIELTPSIGVELEYGVARADAQKNQAAFNASPANRFEGDQRNLTANLIVTTDLITQNYSGAFKPYVLVGAGVADYEIKSQLTGATVFNRDDTIGNLGLGAYYRLNDALSLRGEGRATYNFDGEWVEGLALAGLQVVLGGHLKPTFPAPPVIDVDVPTPVDSDGDGVVDSLDKCPGTPRGVSVDANGCPALGSKVVTIPLNVFFDTDKSNIKPQYQGEITKVVNFMKQYPTATTVIEGHTDSRGSAKYNQRLSQRRAKSVKMALVNRGINPARLNSVGYGEARPIASNKTAEGRAQNRRVHAVVSGKKTVRK